MATAVIIKDNNCVITNGHSLTLTHHNLTKAPPELCHLGKQKMKLSHLSHTTRIARIGGVRKEVGCGRGTLVCFLKPQFTFLKYIQNFAHRGVYTTEGFAFSVRRSDLSETQPL